MTHIWEVKNIYLKVKNNGREVNWSYAEVIISIVNEELKKKKNLKVIFAVGELNVSV